MTLSSIANIKDHHLKEKSRLEASDGSTSHVEISITASSPTKPALIEDNYSVERSKDSDTELNHIINQCMNEPNVSMAKNDGATLNSSKFNKRYSKVTLRFKHSTKWIPTMKNKHSSQSLKELSSSSQPNFSNQAKQLNIPKPSKKISLNRNSLIPKRFSMNKSNSLKIQTQKPSAISTRSSKSSLNTLNFSLSSEQNFHNSNLPPSPAKSTNAAFLMKSTSPMPTSTSVKHSIPERADSNFSSSSNTFRRTAKSILFSEFASTEMDSPCSSDSENDGIDDAADRRDDGSEGYVNSDDENDNDMPVLRRSISYTDSDRRQVLSFILSSPPSKNSATPVGDYVSQTKSSRYSDYKASGTKTDVKDRKGAHTRSRSKTMDNSENPFNESENSSTSILGSIANFVKINRSPSISSMKPIVKAASMDVELPSLSKNDEPEKYLEKIIEAYPLPLICEILSKENKDILKSTMQEYLKKFYDFSNEPLDFSLRKFLMLNNLPPETQQIDRVIYQFAKHYHSCNPHLGIDNETLYILTYSLIMVHTDKFNPNNKRKMTRFEFIHNVLDAIESNNDSIHAGSLQGFLGKELIGYLYDNITYTPLIKISPEQSVHAVEALKSNSPYPYPKSTFLGGSNPHKESEYRKLSISSSLSAASSTPLSNRTNSQQSLQIPTHSRRKSTAFLWSGGSNEIDPYDYIVKNSPEALSSLRLLNDNSSDINIGCKIPFLPARDTYDHKDDEIPSAEMIRKQLDDFGEALINEVDTVLLENIWRTATEDEIGFILKLPKGHGSYLLSTSAEPVSLNDNDGDEFYLARVIKVGMIDKQETGSTAITSFSPSIPVPKPDSTDMSTIDMAKSAKSSSRKSTGKIWKPYFCILTTVGMFLFENIATFRMKYCGCNKYGNNVVIIEEATPKVIGFKEFGTSQDNEHSSDSAGFMSFPYFKSDKSEKSEKDRDPDIFEDSQPKFTINPDCFATRKIQNIAYDKTVNRSLSFSSGSDSLKSQAILPPMSDSGNSELQNEEPNSSFNTRMKNHGTKFPSPKDAKYTFFIYSKDSKNIYMVTSLSELKSWIHSINAMATLHLMEYDYRPLDYSIILKNNSDMTGKKCEKYYEIVPPNKGCICVKKKSKDISHNKDKETVLTPFYTESSNQLYEISRKRNNTVHAGSLSPTESHTEIEHSDGGISNIEREESLASIESSKAISEYESAIGNTIKPCMNDFKIQEGEGIRTSTDTNNFGNAQKLGSSSQSSVLSDSKESFAELLQNLYSVQNLKIVMPLQKSTRDELLSTLKILGVKLEWLWFDRCKAKALNMLTERIKQISNKSVGHY